MMQKIKNLIKIILSSIYFPLLAWAAKKKISNVKSVSFSPEESYNWTDSFRVGPSIRGLNINFRSSQIREEIIGLVSELKKNPPKTVLEIGTATGGTLFMFTKAAPADACIFSIDLPFGRYGAGYLKYRIPLMEEFASNRQKMHLLRLDSHAEATISRLKELLAGQSIDFLFIDGDHSYEGVKADFENYYPLVKPGGLIAFHDIVANDLDPSFGTQAFWNEIKSGFEHQEFIKQDRGNTGCGIGLIRKPS